MSWEKKGQIFVPDRSYEWMISHAQMPVVDLLEDNRIRVYFGTRNSNGHTQTSYIDCDAENPELVHYHHDEIVLGCGRLGCFDDGGAMPSWILNHQNQKYLYYVGWNAGVTVSYRNSIGLAISDDGGKSFHRAFQGPIVDRSKDEPHWCSTPCVLKEDNLWRMWYLNATEWQIINGRPEPYCHIKYAESDDGVVWRRCGEVAIERKEDEGGMTKPHVIYESGIYKMWYAFRGPTNYRADPNFSYRIGYAESIDGKSWKRKDDQVGIDVSETGWDSLMISFPSIYDFKGKRYMLYNGNGFGETGIGYAVWVGT